jgi:putative hydrolase
VGRSRKGRDGTSVDLNAVAAALLRDLASIQTSPHKERGYRGAAAAVMRLEAPLAALRPPGGPLPKIAGVGPSSERILYEVLETGGSATVEAAIAASSRAADVTRRRALRTHLLSRSRVVEILRDSSYAGPEKSDYRGDLQMHSVWSDGALPLAELVEACVARGYAFSAITDHSYGLPSASGLSAADLQRQHQEIDEINAAHAGTFRLLKGVEANIRPEGDLDLTADELAPLELVLAAPHAKLRETTDQTSRMLRVVTTPGIHVLAHPRGRKLGERAGIVADWPRVFAAAAAAGVAVEIDGDPSRQDLDHTLARVALDAGCLFALDSDAHNDTELVYAETALAHARLAGIPPARIINCWKLDRLLTWASDRKTRRVVR